MISSEGIEKLKKGLNIIFEISTIIIELHENTIGIGIKIKEYNENKIQKRDIATSNYVPLSKI